MRSSRKSKFDVNEYRATAPNRAIKTWLVLGFILGCFGEKDMNKLANLLYELGWFNRAGQ